LDEESEEGPDTLTIRRYQAEKNYMLLPTDANKEILGNYLELVVQFGFIVLFSCIFPLAAFVSFLSN